MALRALHTLLFSSGALRLGPLISPPGRVSCAAFAYSGKSLKTRLISGSLERMPQPDHCASFAWATISFPVSLGTRGIRHG